MTMAFNSALNKAAVLMQRATRALCNVIFTLRNKNMTNQYGAHTHIGPNVSWHILKANLIFNPAGLLVLYLFQGHLQFSIVNNDLEENRNRYW